MKQTLLIFFLFTSCATYRSTEKAYICMSQQPVINGVVHQFENLTHTYGRIETPDSAICKVGDTLIIKDFKRRVYFYK
jgi:hypothetical protein